MVAVILGRFTQFLNRSSRRRYVGISKSQIDNVDPGAPSLDF
jgi:hypothetical protein